MSADRWFRRLLRILPADVRADYGGEMARVFREQRRDVGGRAGRLRLWRDAIADVLAIGPREHAAQLAQDIRYAWRGMRRQPGFVTVAILTLALGIGANTAIFSIVHGVLLRPLPYRDPGALAAVWNRWDGTAAASLSDPEYLDYAEQSRAMTIAAAAPLAVNVAAPGRDPERVLAANVTANLLDVLGVRPALGRGFAQEEDAPGAARVAVLSDGFWRQRLGADPGVVGGTLSINGEPHQVIGVLPKGMLLPLEFAGANRVDVLTPLTLDRTAPRNRRGGHYLRAVARLAPGATIPSASAEMTAIVERLIREYPDEHDQGHFAVVVRPLRDDLLGGSRAILMMLAGAVGLVLLLACANVANLMLARGESRRRELAVRAALGADRFRIVRQLLTESCAISLAGAAAGLAVASWCQQLVIALGGLSLPRLDQIALDGPVLAFTAAVAVLTGVAFGIAPAMQLPRAGAGEALKDGTRGNDPSRARVRRVLVVSQVSIAAILLIAAGLLIKSFVRLTSVPSGIDPDGVLTLRVSLPDARYPGRPEVSGFFSRVLERVRALPGVEAAGAGSGLPLAVASGDWSFDIEGRGRIGSRYPGAADWYVVSPGYFEALGIPLRRGRLPLASDGSDAAPVVFINEQTARALFPGDDPVGRRIRLAFSRGPVQPWRTIAGVVGDVRHRGLETPPRTEIFIPYEQFIHFSANGQARAMTIVVKTRQPPMSLAPALRAELRAVDPEVPAAQVRDMATVVSASVADRRMNVALFGMFGALALVVAVVGLYGVMAYSVAQRTREMGVRIAIGASRRDVLMLVIGDGLRLVAAGLAIGLAIAAAIAHAMSGLLYDVGPRDLTIFTIAPLTLLAASLIAAYVPARRATRVDPVGALRAE